jgi:general secretion pathway protein B
MSYILDALKKLEHEKSRKSRGNGMINISGALFENERPRPSETAGWKIALAVTVAVLITFGTTWLFLQSGKGRRNPSPRPATTAPQTPPAPPAPPAPPVSVVIAPSPPVAAPVVPVQQTLPTAPPAPAQVTPVRPPARPAKPQNNAVQAATATGNTDVEPAMQEPRPRANEPKGQALPADQADAAPADIKLSGIAWQEERRARRAVVNGFLMQEGGVVSGARISNIYQDRVRFSLSGKTFEIPLTSSAAPAAGK